MNFKERSREMEYSNLYYPYADKGPKKMRRLQVTFVSSLISFISSFICKFISNSIKVNAVNLSQTAATASETVNNDSSNKVVGLISWFSGAGGALTSSGTVFKQVIKTVFLSISFITKILGILLILLSIIFLINYLINVVKRNREYERNVIINDFKAVALYRKVQGSLKISKRLREAKKSARPKSSGGSSEPPSADSLSKVEEFKLLRKMDIRINTRQKLTSNKINTIYSIFVEVPLDEQTTQSLIKRMETLNDTFTRLARGQVTMGGYLITEDRQLMVIQGETPDLDDPYDYSKQVEKLKEKDVEIKYYDSAYKISNLVDRTADIESKKALAEEWAHRTGEMLDRFLITSKMKVTRINTNVASSKATFVYDLATDSNLSSGFSKFDEALDKTFKTVGSSVGIVNGHLEVVLPIPKEYRISINVPSLYRDAFGAIKNDK